MLALSTGRLLVRPGISGRKALHVRNVEEARKTPAAKRPAASKVAAAPKPKEEKLKRAPSAMNLFVKARFPSIKKEHPALKFAELSKMVTSEWKQASSEVKAPFEKQAQELKAEVAAKREAAKKDKKANAKPPTAFVLYANEVRSMLMAEHPGKRVTELAGLIGQKWKQLSDEEQNKYKDAAKALLEAWKAKHGAVAA